MVCYDINRSVPLSPQTLKRKGIPNGGPFFVLMPNQACFCISMIFSMNDTQFENYS